AARFAYFANGVETLWDKVWKDLAPKLSQAITVTIPKLAGRITNLENDLYKTGADSLPQIRTRLKVLEAKFAGLLKGLTFRDAVLGMLAALAGVTVAVLTATLPSLFCRNTRGVAKRLCAFDETMLANLLLGTLLFSLVLDLRALANEAWSRYQSMPVEVVLAANVVASGERSYAWGLGQAHNQGISDDGFQALVDFSDTAPGLASLYDLLHRGLISEGDFREGARKQLIEDKWVGPLLALAQRILSPAEAANAWQQGFMSEAEAEAEAERSGVSPARLATQRPLAGDPPRP